MKENNIWKVWGAWRWSIWLPKHCVIDWL